MIIRVQRPTCNVSPVNRVDRRQAPRRRGLPKSDPSQRAQEYAAAGLPVFPLAPGGKRQRNQCGKHEAATDADRIRVWRRRWLTASIGLRPLRVVCRTRRGQAT